LRREGCSIIVFENDLGTAAREWTEGLRGKAKAVRSLVGHEVFVFPSSTVMEGEFKETEWQGNFFVLLDPRTILSATSDRYLESVLQRVKVEPKARALPDTLPEWKHVDLDAPVWMIRHRPRVHKKTRTIGVTAAFRRDGFRVEYIPNRENDEDGKRAKDNWTPASLVSEPGATKDRLKVDRQDDGTVVLSFAGKFISAGESVPDLWLAWQLYWLQAFEVFHPEE
jgi:hypothetical protein